VNAVPGGQAPGGGGSGYGHHNEKTGVYTYHRILPSHRTNGIRAGLGAGGPRCSRILYLRGERKQRVIEDAIHADGLRLEEGKLVLFPVR
jgi:hypothetical protein